MARSMSVFQRGLRGCPSGLISGRPADGTVAAQASTDGDWIYFTRSDRDGLWRAPRGAADAGTLIVQAIPSFNTAGWVVAGEWVYFTADADTGVWLDAVPVTGGRPVHRASLNQMTWPGFSISPDGRHVMYARWDRRESNIMSIEY